MTEPPPLRHWWLVALGKTLRFVIDYAEQASQAHSAEVKIVTPAEEDAFFAAQRPKQKEPGDGG